jgi:beta-lactam-binding protein with PASTA domain
MKRYFRLALGALAMVATMLLSAAITLRIALHGGEVSVPDFSGMTVAEASEAALHNRLGLTIENRFYSTTVPAGRMLSQAPAPGSRVRHAWQVRVTESLGPQQVTIPNVVGEPMRAASIDIRRDSLDLGTVGHIDAPGDAEIVLAQTPPPNAGVDQPRVSLLLSSEAGSASSAIVAPSFVGMSYSAASHAAAGLGLRVNWVSDITAPAPAAKPVTPVPAKPATQASPAKPGAATAVTTASPAPPPVVMVPAGPVTAQKPESGNRVSPGDTVRLSFGHAGANDSGDAP